MRRDTFPAWSSCPRWGRPRSRSTCCPGAAPWSFTTQDFPPKEPYASGETNETFVPYGIGMVQLGNEVRVEARLTESDPEKLAIGRRWSS